MILLLDAGNSRLKWAMLQNGEFKQGGSFAYVARTISEQASAEWSELERPEAVMVANVAGEPFRRALNSWTKRRWKLIPQYMRATAEAFGVRNAYREPERLGIDRWLALLGARELFDGALCVVDCGTALTIDVLAQDGRHQGGLIIPGMCLMQAALTGCAEAIRQQIAEASHEQVALLGTDTGSAVAGGTLYAEVAVIDRVLQDLRSELGEPLRCVLTGGDAGRLAPLLAVRCDLEPDIVLRGLARIARNSVGTQPDRPRKVGPA